MFELVTWSFVVALTPLALGLVWNLISKFGDLVGGSFFVTDEGGRHRGPARRVRHGLPA